jgi:membrane protein
MRQLKELWNKLQELAGRVPLLGMILRLLGRLWSVIEKTVTRWTANDGNLLAASMAYYAAFSFYPLLWVLMAVLGYGLRFSDRAQGARQELLGFLGKSMSPALADEVDRLLSGVQLRAGSGIFAGFLLLFAAIGVFSQLEAAFDRLWHAVTPHHRGARAAIRNALWNRLKAFLTLIGLGVIVLIAFVAQIVLSAMESWAQEEHLVWAAYVWPRLQITLSLTLNTLALAMVFKMVPRVFVRWREALMGGVVVAAAWQIGAQIVSRYIVGGHYTAYGVVGSFIAMMLWVYCASIILCLGAQFVQVLGHPEESTVLSEATPVAPTDEEGKPAGGIAIGKNGNSHSEHEMPRARDTLK